MGCSGGKSAQVKEPAKDGSKTAATVGEPKTLLANDGDDSQKVDLLKKYLVDVNAASESEVRETLEGLTMADRKKLADALGIVDAPLHGDDLSASVHKALGSYLDDVGVASTSEVHEALQGLPIADRQRLAGALDSLLALDVKPVTAVEVDTTVLAEDTEAQAKLGDSLTQGDPEVLEPVLLEPEQCKTKGWFSCCIAPVDSSVDVIVIPPDSAAEVALEAEKQ